VIQSLVDPLVKLGQKLDAEPFKVGMEMLRIHTLNAFIDPARSLKQPAPGIFQIFKE